MAVRLGFVGAGYMGQLAHISRYAALADVTLAALAEQRPGLAQRVGEAYGFEKVYPDHRAMLDEAKLDAVVAIAPFQLNAPLVQDVLEAGLAVITEKPQTTTSERGRELIELAASKGVVYQVGYMKRFDPAVRWAKQRIAQWRAGSEVGPMLSLRTWCAHGQWQWYSDPPIRTDEKVPASSLMREQPPAWMSEAQWREHIAWINYYSHQTNLVRYLAGDYTLEHVRQRRQGQITSTYVTASCDEDDAHVYFDFTAHTVPHWDEGIEVRFGKALLRIELPAPLARNRAARVTVVSEADGEMSPAVKQRDGFTMQARGFVGSLRGQEAVLSPASEAVKDVEVSERVIAMLAGGDGTPAAGLAGASDRPAAP